MTERRITHCRKCGERIFFALTSNGKVAPIDADPVPDGNITISQRAGKEFAIIGKTLGLFAERYVPHFATCPHANLFRKGLKTKGTK